MQQRIRQRDLSQKKSKPVCAYRTHWSIRFAQRSSVNTSPRRQATNCGSPEAQNREVCWARLSSVDENGAKAFLDQTRDSLGNIRIGGRVKLPYGRDTFHEGGWHNCLWAGHRCYIGHSAYFPVCPTPHVAGQPAAATVSSSKTVKLCEKCYEKQWPIQTVANALSIWRRSLFPFAEVMENVPAV